MLPTIVVGFCRIASAENNKGKVWEFLRKPWVLWFTYSILLVLIIPFVFWHMWQLHTGQAKHSFCITKPIILVS